MITKSIFFQKKNIFWKKVKVEKIFFQTKIWNSWTKCQWKKVLPCDTKIYVHIHHTTMYTHTYTHIHIYKLCKIMASSPIASWQIDGEKMETVTDFILGGSKIIADSDCSHKIKRHFLLARKAMTNLDSVLKSRDITLPTKVHLVKAMFFSLVMYGCESWTIKKAECQRTDAFELWCWKDSLRVPWTARRSNQSI